jgi:glycerol-3-phosphate dehydrogenase
MQKAIGMAADRRTEYLAAISRGTLDLLVIGGGITGAGIALDAASRGLSVGLVEKADFASGTSSRSTKLIHGGLRYLKQGDVRLVREVGAERAILHRNAPHVVIPEKMLLPVVEGGTYGRIATSVGLWVYDWLVGVARDERRKMLDRDEALAAEPLLRRDILKGAGLYFEYRTDDARLTVEVLKTAVDYGAICCNYAEVTDFVYAVTDAGRKLVGARVLDRLAGRTYEVRARSVVNATGPWVDHLRETDQSRRGKRLHLTKGVHIVVPHSRLPIRQSVYFDVPDGRMVFAIPREGTTYIGTTDTDYHGDVDRPRALRADVAYLLSAANSMFPSVHLTLADVESTWAGLRPLIHKDGKSASELSRKDEIFVSPSGLVSIAGGKLTGYRKMAERVVDLVVRRLQAEDGRPFVPCRTADIRLSGGDCSHGDLLREIRLTSGELSQEVVSEVLQSLAKYGGNARRIAEFAAKVSPDELRWLVPEATDRAAQDPAAGDHAGGDAAAAASANHTIRWLLAELQYAVEFEMATNLTDFLIRRTGRLFFRRREAAAVCAALNDWLAARFGWDDERKQAELTAFVQQLDACVSFPEAD